MPIYEYVSKTDGEVIELVRPMAQADQPVEDPKGLGRVFERRLSTFAAKGAPNTGGSSAGGCCPCGKGAGACSRP